MFRLIRYIALILLILLCMFWLDKHGVNVRLGLDRLTNNAKSFFESIKTSPKGDSGKIFKDITKQDFVGDLASSTHATTVKSYLNDSNYINIPDAKISVDGIIYYTNLERIKAGLSPLAKSSALNKSANIKADDMFTNQYFEHASPDGKTAADLVRAVNYKFQIVGENLALGVFNTDQMLVQAWMNSPTHRANILNPKFTEIGVAVSIGEYKNQKQWMAVQHFAKPMPICGNIDEVLQNNINLEKTALEVEERELQKMAGIIETTSPENLESNYLNNYNERVNNYNKRLNELRDTIEKFNKTIVDYNNCLKTN